MLVRSAPTLWQNWRAGVQTGVSFENRYSLTPYGIQAEEECLLVCSMLFSVGVWLCFSPVTHAPTKITKTQWCLCCPYRVLCYFVYVYIYMIEEFECAVITRVSYQDKCVVLQSNDAYELHVLWKRRVKIHCDFSNSRLDHTIHVLQATPLCRIFCEYLAQQLRSLTMLWSNIEQWAASYVSPSNLFTNNTCILYSHTVIYFSRKKTRSFCTKFRIRLYEFTLNGTVSNILNPIWS